MRFHLLFVAMLLLGSIAYSQENLVAMRIGERPVSLDEFRYFYGKNAQGSAIGNLKLFVKAFVDYQLKVQAALDAHLDASLMENARFQNTSGEQNLSQTFNASKQDEAVKVAHILVAVRQKADSRLLDKARSKADSIYRVLKNGADFAEMAQRYSDDKESAGRGGELPWIKKGQTTQDLERIFFSLNEIGAVKAPQLSEFGFHIVKLEDRSDSKVRSAVLREGARNVRYRVVTDGLTNESVVKPLKYTWRGRESEMEYGKLVREIYLRSVVNRAACDKQGLRDFYDRNRKVRRYKGLTVDDPMVVADYQDRLETEWLASLRTRYKVNVNWDALATVNVNN